MGKNTTVTGAQCHILCSDLTAFSRYCVRRVNDPSTKNRYPRAPDGWHSGRAKRYTVEFVSIGSRLTVVLLAALMPVIGIYTYWSVHRSTGAYVINLEREIRATTLGLAPSIENDLREHEFDQIRDVLVRMSSDNTMGALIGLDGKVWYSP